MKNWMLLLILGGASLASAADMACHHIGVVLEGPSPTGSMEAYELSVEQFPDMYRDVCEFSDGTVVVTEVLGDDLSVTNYTIRTWHRQRDKENLEMARLDYRLKHKVSPHD
jgi:hypothetical protein